MAFFINKIFPTITLLIDHTINLSGSIVGGAIAIGGLTSGFIAGMVLGTLLSTQLLWTKKPLTIPMTLAFSAVLYSSCCEMDSVDEMHRLLNTETLEPSKISVINVINDEVIQVPASLNAGLGLKPGKQPENENQPLKDKITSFWYSRGGHNGKLSGLVHPTQPFESKIF